MWVEIEVRRLDGWAAPTLSHCLRLDSGGVLSMSIGAGSLGRRWIVLYTAHCTLHSALCTLRTWCKSGGQDHIWWTVGRAVLVSMQRHFVW